MREYYATSQQVQCFAEVPSEEFELKANSLGPHIKNHGKLILRTLSYLTVKSKDDSHFELALSFP